MAGVVVPSVQVIGLQQLVKLEELSEKTGLTLLNLAYDQMRLWCIDMLGMTRPGRGAQAKKKGYENITADANTLFYIVDSDAALAKWKKDAVAKGGDIYRTTKGRSKTFKVAMRKLNDAELGRMFKFHAKQRNKGGGVKSPRVDQDLLGQGKMVVTRTLFKKFIKQQKEKVGLLKSGWEPGVRFFAAKANRPVTGRQVHKWVSKAATKVPYPKGKASANMDSKGNGSLVAVNLIPYASKWITGALMNNARMKRQKDIQTQLGKRLKKLIR